MIKRCLKRLLLFVIAFILFETNANALVCPDGATCNIENDEVHFTYNGEELYCVSDHVSPPKSFANCSITPIGVTGVSGGYFQARDELRYAFQEAGIWKGTGNTTAKKGNVKVYAGSSSIQMSYTLGQSDASGAIATVTVSSKYATEVYIKSGNATILTNANLPAGGGSVQIRINGNFASSGSKKNCKGTKVVVGAKYRYSKDETTDPTTTDPTSNNTDPTRTAYWIQCPSGQDFVSFSAPAWSTTPSTSNNTDPTTDPGKTKTKNRSKSASITIEVAPDDCCEGETTLCEGCGTLTSKDNVKERKSCANFGGFKKYCDRDVQKTVDGTTGTLVTDKSRSVTPTKGLSSGRFCSVYCLEEIEYFAPDGIKTVGGRYFKLRQGFDLPNGNAGEATPYVKGKRTCITSEIKVADYRNAMQRIQETIRTNWNEYMYNKKLAEAIGEATEKNDNYTEKVNGKDYEYTKKIIEGTFTYTEYTQPSYDGNHKGITGGLIPQKKNGEFKYTTYDEKSGFTKTKDAYKKEKEAISKAKYNVALNTQNVEMYDTIEEFKSCYDWTNSYECFDPKAYFTYDEGYNSLMKGYLTVKSTIGTDNRVGATAGKYYQGEPDEEYSDAGSGSRVNATAHYIYLTDEELTKENNSPYMDAVSIYVKKEIEATREFGESTDNGLVYTYKPTGTIKVSKTKPSEPNYRLVSDGYVFPVTLEHPDKRPYYNYHISFENVGVSGNDSKGSCSVGGINGKAGESCTLTVQEARKQGRDCSASGEMQCQYQVSPCKDCDLICECDPDDKTCTVDTQDPTKCHYETRGCKTCDIVTIGPMWDNGDTTVIFKPISLNKVFNTGEKVGYNWAKEGTSEPIDLVKQIEEKGQKAYENPTYKFVLTPTTMSKIRDYNKKSLSGEDNVPKGGYGNNTLTCPGEEDGATCFSSFFKYLNDRIDANAIKLNKDELVK